MAPRTILHTGKGGAGKTTLAIATARRCARDGRRTLLLSLDGTRDLSHLLATELGEEPVQAGERLWAAELRPQALVGDALAALRALRAHHDARACDVLVADCPPTEQALQLLALPGLAAWGLERRTPADAEGQRVGREAISAGELLRDHERVTLRVVATADPLAIAHARRALTCAGLYGVLADAVLFAGEGDPPSFAPVPVVRDLDAVDPAAILREHVPQELTLAAAEAELRLDLPFATAAGVSLGKAGAELVVQVDGRRRAVALPPGLASWRADAMRLEDGQLRVRLVAGD